MGHASSPSRAMHSANSLETPGTHTPFAQCGVGLVSAHRRPCETEIGGTILEVCGIVHEPPDFVTDDLPYAHTPLLPPLYASVWVVHVFGAMPASCRLVPHFRSAVKTSDVCWTVQAGGVTRLQVQSQTASWPVGF